MSGYIEVSTPSDQAKHDANTNKVYRGVQQMGTPVILLNGDDVSGGSFGIKDGANLDAFGRLRVSNILTQFDLKQLSTFQPLLVDVWTSGTAAQIYDATNSLSQLSTTASGDAVIVQTKQRFVYQSGKSQLIFMTFTDFDTSSGQTKRIGYFHSTTNAPYASGLDGLFLESKDGTISINVYSNGSQIQRVEQDQFNIDKLDGTGNSKLTVDWSLAQVLSIDFQWLGVGRVRWGLALNGQIIHFHQSNNSNIVDNTYMSTPNQPLRWQMKQDGGTASSFKYICATVGSQGAFNTYGKTFAVNDGGTHIDANTLGTKYAAVGIKLKQDRIDQAIEHIEYSLLGTTNDNFLWQLYINPTVAGTFTYSDLSSYSSVQIAFGATANTVSNGTLLDCGYVEKKTSITASTSEHLLRIGSYLDGTVDELILTIQPLTANLDIFRSVSWVEKS